MVIKRMAVGAPLLVLWGLGCGATPSDEPALQERSAVDDLEVRAPSRGKVRGGERMRRTVQWPAEATRALAAYEAFDARGRAAIDESPVPVLVPGPELALDQREVLRGPEWYSFWGHREHEGVEVTVTLQASRMARVYPGVRPQPGPHTLRGREGLVTRNEGIWSASWIEHGVAYDLGLECAPVDAAPCDDQAEIEALAEGLLYAGGQGEAGEAREKGRVMR